MLSEGNEMKHTILIIMGCVIAFAPVMTRAAAVVEARYSQGGGTVGLMTYSGPDGGADSDPARYWVLLGKAPELASQVKIKPDSEGGKTATLKGDVKISVTIRNQFNMGTVKTDKLTLARDDDHSDNWYIPVKELERIKAPIAKESMKSDSKPTGVHPANK